MRVVLGIFSPRGQHVLLRIYMQSLVLAETGSDEADKLTVKLGRLYSLREHKMAHNCLGVYKPFNKIEKEQLLGDICPAVFASKRCVLKACILLHFRAHQKEKYALQRAPAAPPLARPSMQLPAAPTQHMHNALPSLLCRPRQPAMCCCRPRTRCPDMCYPSSAA